MAFLEVLASIIIGYFLLLLLLEAVIWKAQPSMDSGVTLFINQGGTVFARKLYGFDYHNKLYVSSNHWFRQWYYAILEEPQIAVEHAGAIKPVTAVPIDGEELSEVAREYKMGVVLRLMCGFAPRRFLRLDPRQSDDAT